MNARPCLPLPTHTAASCAGSASAARAQSHPGARTASRPCARTPARTPLTAARASSHVRDVGCGQTLGSARATGVADIAVWIGATARPVERTLYVIRQRDMSIYAEYLRSGIVLERRLADTDVATRGSWHPRRVARVQGRPKRPRSSIGGGGVTERPHHSDWRALQCKEPFVFSPISAVTAARPRETGLPARPMRCACGYCGAHTITTVGYAIGGNCSNCGSYDLVPLAPARHRPAGRPHC